MSQGRVAFRVRARLGAAALWVVACSAGVDGYRLVNDHSKDGSNPDASTGGDGGGSAAGGSGGRVSNGGSGNVGNGGTGANTVLPTGGTGGDEAGGSGGDEAGGSGGDEAGGAPSGGTGAGGMGAGGAGNGGSAGKGTGGSGNGGTGSGGTGAGGKGSGGTGTGGTGAGGMGTGGMGPVDPTVVNITGAPLTGITAAAWDGQVFQLLQPGSRQFVTVDPGTGTAAMHSLPDTGTVVSSVIGAAPGASASLRRVFVIAGSNIFRIPGTGWTSEAGTGITVSTVPTGAYSNGYLLVGDVSGTGKTAQTFNTSTNGVATATALGVVYAVGSDSESLAFETLDNVNQRLLIHRIAPGSFATNKTPCQGGGFVSNANQISVAGQSVAWTLGAGGGMGLNFATISGGICQNATQIPYASAANLPTAVGLIDETHALVVDDYSVGSGHVSIHDRAGGAGNLLLVNFGGKSPQSIIVGPPHYAVIVTGNNAVVVHF